MTKEEIIELAREAGVSENHAQGMFGFIEHFADLVAAKERERILDEWSMCVQSDLEHGVKSLNEQAAVKWRKDYPAISAFDDFLLGV